MFEEDAIHYGVDDIFRVQEGAYIGSLGVERYLRQSLPLHAVLDDGSFVGWHNLQEESWIRRGGGLG